MNKVPTTAFDLPDPQRTAPIFAALGDAHRLSIVMRLCAAGPLTTLQLGKAAPGVSRQGVTKHLRVLQDAGLLDSQRLGRERQWQLRAHQIAELRRYLSLVSAHWDVRLERLKAMVETDDT